MLAAWTGGASQSSLLTGLVAYWALEAGGTDSTGRGNDLSSSVGAPAYAAAKVANGFSGNGSSFIHRASTADLEIGTRDFEICCWINPSDLTGGNRRFLCKANTGNSYLLRVAADGTPQIICWSGTVLAQATKPAGTITTGSWFFIDVAFTSATKQWGVAVNNGAFTNVATSTTTIDLTPSEPLTLGAGWGGGTGNGFWSGLIDEVGFWARNLTVAERTALYNGGTGRTWPFVGA